MQAWGLTVLLAAALLAGTATNCDTEADQATADTVAARAAEAEDLQLAVYVAEHDAVRSQHPSAAEPVRRRHPSALPESDQ
ncbi:hypothetical protein GT347_20110 [Xylophilus rhododendri]|uniref:Lipoprotein n=1 Tax=Xylophilus rhododendri TaxID=2697032 RepID=A0A857JAL1_9BURK|nr:hypothetical protein [Xylophilus rhododendri]QHJ00080.1 hypothetical protein GT347_20110 [Xylophilus rhododendri]